MDKKILKIFRQELNSKSIQKHLKQLKKYHKESYEHSLRVGLLCIYLGYENNLSIKKIKLLCCAGLLHDLGKLNIPLDILLKKTKLNKKERDEIKKHPRTGFLRLKETEFNKVRKIVVMHHECCAFPYPRNQKNKIKKNIDRRSINEYNELAEILSVADHYDALSHARAYHKALGCSEIIKIMTKQFKGKKKYINQVMTKCLIDNPVQIKF